MGLYWGGRIITGELFASEIWEFGGLFWGGLIYLFIYLSLYLFISLFIYLFIYLFFLGGGGGAYYRNFTIQIYLEL